MATRVVCESLIPDIFRDALGEPTDSSNGFLVPLPAQVFDGAPHELIVRLCTPRRDHPKAETNKLAGDWLLESRLVFQKGDRHGQVSAADQYFQGWIAFNNRPNPLPLLTLSDAQGNLCKQIALIPLPTETGHPDKFLATFRISQTGLPIPLRFHCGEIELKGSPCQPKPKLAGFLEKLEPQAIHGWAFDMNQPANPVELVLKIDGQVIQHFRPNIRRPDIAKHLKLAAENLGIVGFQLTPPEILFDGEAHRISVEFAGMDHPLHGSGQLMRLPKTCLSLSEIIPLAKKIRHAKAIERPRRPKVSVIILNRDGEIPLAAFLESWKKQNSLINIELIVVDHASKDGSLGLLKRWQSQLPLHIIPLSCNDSFSASCNRAAAEARGQFLLFMNNDIVWLQDALLTMVQALESDREIGALGLKLLKSTDDGRMLDQVQVQHLGIRFKLSESAYWPYEANPDEGEAEYSPQTVPAVTAAVMLCRKDDFLHAGQFESSYFYGFEDVEFCLRLGNRLNKKIICRNDLVALHRHGYSRLSGRTADIVDCLVNNADILQAHAGLWLKRNYWASLLNADQHLTVEKLTIGFIIDEAQTDNSPTSLRASASKLAGEVSQCYPAARIVFLPPSLGWYNLRNIHVLVVGHPEYNIGNITHRREDLLTLAWVRDDASLWTRMPWWQHFDGYVVASPALKKHLAPSISNPIAQTTAALPLGPLLNPQSALLRVALLTPHKMSAQHKTTIDALQQSLQAAGAVVWQDPFDAANGSTRVADVRIYTCPNKTLPRVELKPQPHTLNILWAPHIKPAQNADHAEGWQIVSQMPEADWLNRAIERTLGNTFRSS